MTREQHSRYHRNSTWYVERLAVDCAVVKVHMCLLSLSEWSIFSFLLSWIYKMHLVGLKMAFEEVAKGEVNRINDTATPEENKKFNEHKNRKDAAGKTMYCSVDTILSFCMYICKWHVFHFNVNY